MDSAGGNLRRRPIACSIPEIAPSKRCCSQKLTQDKITDNIKGSGKSNTFDTKKINTLHTMAPPNAETQVVDNLAEQVEKIDLKQLGREKGRYLVYPEKTVSHCSNNGVNDKYTKHFYSTPNLNHLSTRTLACALIPRRLLFTTMPRRYLT